MKTAKQEITIDRGLYGTATVVAYCAGGLAVHKTGRGNIWRITHIKSGHAIWFGLDAPTRAVAIDRMEKLIALDIPWSSAFEDLRVKLGEHATVIRALAK